ncbi:MAG: helix-turn-helix domain-containing protein, partial [Rhodocyclaceae bacterium]
RARDNSTPIANVLMNCLVVVAHPLAEDKSRLESFYWHVRWGGLAVRRRPHLDWRSRERAQSVRLLAERKTCKRVAALQDLTMKTVSTTRRPWIEHGLDGLSGRVRGGAPVKLSATDIGRLTQWARDEP